MKINFNEKDKLLNLEIDEEIDHHKAEILRRNADYEIQRRNPKRVILDFNNVYFMDSAGIGMVIGRYKTASMIGAKIEMKNVKPNIRKIFDISKRTFPPNDSFPQDQIKMDGWFLSLW